MKQHCSICGVPRPSKKFLEKGWTTYQKRRLGVGTRTIKACPKHHDDTIYELMEAWFDGHWEPGQVLTNPL